MFTLLPHDGLRVLAYRGVELVGHVRVLRTPVTPPLDLDGLLTIEFQGRV